MKNPFMRWTKKDFIGHRADDGWKKALKKNRKISLTNPQSKRFWIEGDDYQPYTSDQIAKSGEYPEIETDTFSGTASGPIEEADIDSTAIEMISYDPDTKDLGIVYKNGNGKEYIFPNVPKEEVEALMNAPSKGKYVAYIIKPKYGV